MILVKKYQKTITSLVGGDTKLMLIFPLTVLYKNVSEIIGDPKEFKMAIQEQERIGTYFSFESSLKR